MKKTKKLTINKYPEKIKDSVIYEVNIRQYTEEGTFKAFKKHIPRLKELGVDILWLMPVHPVGQKNKKGELGSSYSVQNYTEINPEFGTKEDFADLVEYIHKNRMMIILDWVANHTAWDNVWIDKHKDWYIQDSSGNIVSPCKDWEDVAKLDYQNRQMRQEMIKSMQYWLSEFDIDGFRCDMAMLVPTDFWNDARKELEKVKPVFMLAEAEEPDLMISAFNANYSWDLLHLAESIAKAHKRGVDLIDYFLDDPKKFISKTIRMTFTTNHDENSWNGTVFERFGDSYKTFSAFMFVIPGMPLIYNGQEACVNKRIKFFDKDSIEWKNCEMSDFLKKLCKLKHQNKALWNGQCGSPLVFVPCETNFHISTFIRQKDENKLLLLFNLSNNPTEVKYTDTKAEGHYFEYFSGEKYEIKVGNTYKLKPWEFLILIEKIKVS